MKTLDLACRATTPLAAAVLFTLMIVPVTAQTLPDKQIETQLPMPALAAAKVPCDSPMEMLRLANPLSRVAHKLRTGAPIVIVALGSSSTAGSGASSVSATYPSQLGQDLQRRFPKNAITVLNKGVNGEEAPDMIKRFDKSVAVNKPDLVIWQLGTNALIRDHGLNDPGVSLRDGLRLIRGIGADVVLVDPQYAPKVIVKPEASHMVEYMSVTAKEEGADLFRRFDVMKRWNEVDHMQFSAFVSPDGLHMNDWGYACMAKGLAMAIAEAAQRPIVSAKIMPPKVVAPGEMAE